MNDYSPDPKDLQREVFHRVSNNFQTIQSMIRLIARDGSIVDPTRELEERIQLLSIAHHAQHCLDSSAMRPLSASLPSLIGGMQGAGLLDGVSIHHTLSGVFTVQRAHAILHIALEVLRALDRTNATHVDIALTHDTLKIASDASGLAPNQTTQNLVKAFARELTREVVVWKEDGLSLRIARTG